MNAQKAYEIALVAHGALGQRRANGHDPFIVHPIAVAELTARFAGFKPNPTCQGAKDRIVCAYLHDVLEDTKITEDHLRALGATERQVELVNLLTKPIKAHKSYYEKIAADPDALVVKCADRCNNLEDALAELLIENLERPKKPLRWERYAEKTRAELLPYYAGYPDLFHELHMRLETIEAELPRAWKRYEKAKELRIAARGKK